MGVTSRTTLFTAFVVLGAACAGARAFDEDTMRLLLEQADELQGCVAELDPGAVAALQSEGEVLTADIRALCQAGKRSDAQARALAFGQRLEASAEMRQVLACAERMGSILPLLLPSVADLAGQGHVCDLDLPQ